MSELKLIFRFRGTTWNRILDAEGQPLDYEMSSRWRNAEVKARSIRPYAKLTRVEAPANDPADRTFYFDVQGRNQPYNVKVHIERNGEEDTITFLCGCPANSEEGAEEEYHWPCYHAVAAISAAYVTRNFYNAQSKVQE